jgi:hypothetical protein
MHSQKPSAEQYLSPIVEHVSVDSVTCFNNFSSTFRIKMIREIRIYSN